MITAAFLVVAAGAAALWRSLQGGLFVEHALVAASHHVQLTTAAFLADVFLY